MSLLTKLKLVASKRERNLSPVMLRRKKLASKIDEQLQLAQSLKNGTLFAPKRLKTLTNEAGERVVVETTGACQVSCRIVHAATCIKSIAISALLMTLSFSGLSVTAPTGHQFLVAPDQRAGWRVLARRSNSWRLARMSASSPACLCAGLTY